MRRLSGPGQMAVVIGTEDGRRCCSRICRGMEIVRSPELAPVAPLRVQPDREMTETPKSRSDCGTLPIIVNAGGPRGRLTLQSARRQSKAAVEDLVGLEETATAIYPTFPGFAKRR